MRRTSLITASSVVAVIVAGTIAVGANTGLLTAADDSEFGSLSAAAELAPAGSGGTEGAGLVALEARAKSDGALGGAQDFEVDEAGTVSVVPSPEGIRIESVHPSSGWTWRLAQDDPTTLSVSFGNGAQTLVFVATLAGDGGVTGTVDDVSATAHASAGDDDDHGGDDVDDDDRDHHDDSDDHDDGPGRAHEEYEHEGRDDDD